jgi:hypothetical protein
MRANSSQAKCFSNGAMFYAISMESEPVERLWNILATS